jgi:transcriptional regulator with XRE-family HTH domain
MKSNRRIEANMRTDREKADEAQIPGQYKELALEVRGLLGYYSDDRPLLSARQAALKSGVNHATIASLVRGGRASRGSLKQLAQSFDVDPGRMIRLAGYAVDCEETANPRELSRLSLPDTLPERIYHKIERLSERDLRRLDQVLELWIDDGHEIGV